MAGRRARRPAGDQHMKHGTSSRSGRSQSSERGKRVRTEDVATLGIRGPDERTIGVTPGIQGTRVGQVALALPLPFDFAEIATWAVNWPMKGLAAAREWQGRVKVGSSAQRGAHDPNSEQTHDGHKPSD